MKSVYLVVPFAPLAGAVLAGLFGRVIGRAGAHWVTITGVAIALLASLLVFHDVVIEGHHFNGSVYTWLSSGGAIFQIGFLLDPLSATMMLVVCFVSLMVHIYTIGYMHDDPGYQRFFSYIALFTFAMLMLVMANNFVQLFFGWEAVGLVSYLLIGFWYTRPSAIFANLKAFLVNRVGDFGFVLGIALVLTHFHTLDYAPVFTQVGQHASTAVEIIPGHSWPLLTVICICLFIGAMGKSAQVPLHVWLPDSMEGPTPISALIHAATMVTAGIFLVARMSPLFEWSDTALAVVLAVGATTALFMGLVAVVQNDIKRVVAYSTLSQLGYMTVALGSSAYSAAIFHLTTHAFFKALLFLGAGSVIIAMHHEQDLRKMGGLRRVMPITYVCMLIGALASIGFPGSSGFFSKDAIIEAAHLAQSPLSSYAHFAVLSCVFVTALYTFRMIFLAFHGAPRWHQHEHAAADKAEHHAHHHGPQESPAVVTVPLVLLAIPSIAAGVLLEPLVFGSYFDGAIVVAANHGAVADMRADYHGLLQFVLHGLSAAPFWLTVAGVATAWVCYIQRPDLPLKLRAAFAWLVWALERKFGFDELYQWAFAGGARKLGTGLWRGGDGAIIDGVLVDGSAGLVGRLAQFTRRIQSGYLYHYAFGMIIGVFVLLTFWFTRP